MIDLNNESGRSADEKGLIRLAGFALEQLRIHPQSDLSIVLVEQNPTLVFDVADDIVILNSGQVAVVSTAAEIRRDGVDLQQHLGVF